MSKIRGARNNPRMMSGKPFGNNDYWWEVQEHTVADCVDAGLEFLLLSICSQAAVDSHLATA